MTLFGSVLMFLYECLTQRRKGAKQDAKKLRLSVTLRLRVKPSLLFQEFSCVAAGAVGDFGAGEHARQFFNATRLV